MPFLRNCWYVAAWDDEIPEQGTFHRRILNEDILLTRDAEGEVRALRNRCPHRFAPLSIGTRMGDAIECAYHGLRFGLDGQCLFNPHGSGQIPANARVQTYKVVVRHLLAWIWMGDPDTADPSAIPDLVGLDPDRFAINRGYMHTPANYEYMTDNIMDLGHIEFLHKGLLGSEAVRHAEIEVKQVGNVVHSNRLTRNEILPTALELLYETEGKPVDRWLDVTWYPPGNMQLVVGVTGTGQPERIGREAPGVHLMTPETDNSTHYFWSNARDFRRDDDQLHAALDQGFQLAFEHQDKPMIMAQHEAIGGEDFWEMHPVILEGDAGAVRARRILRKLIKEEQAVG
ncbi:Rieske 2Fe-2S domain-containing protein [Sphingomonas histidinilytica]|uniref:Vanillate O-demethylase monooxygenase subunit n=1 Tax=Rhizorhabdus histidinilytica TaxID=439228 RepID=A0A1T4ZTH7_9SPHN|nr:aromatic ring-hydroxylating dioxygenase subunit alpha [Rhizorhabdus histidinilytica]MBO9377607.1 Rieske 2Fe-2S domain-containing protein [Rhizorhabdus histidinilytica]SKB25998.1 vanillate O-demethylase monooxygenase subunit [Rhizorhabdus histidinilytica]